MKLTCVILIIILCGLFVFCSDNKRCTINDNLHPGNLRTESRENPVGVDNPAPLFSWESKSTQRAQMQSAYQILVASTPEALNDNDGDSWDSEKVTSGLSLYIPYQGRKLITGEMYFWKVRVWDKNDCRSEWSAPASFTMGMVSASDWNAKWIGMDSSITSTDSITGKGKVLAARMLRKNFTLRGKIKSAVASISGLGLSELYVNGEKIGDRVLSPATTEYNKRAFYVSYNITANLTIGDNVLGVILGNGRFWGLRGGDNTAEYGYPKLLLQVFIRYEDGTDTTVISDNNWKIIAKGPIVANNEYDGETYDAQKEMIGWSKPGFNDNGWLTAKLVNAPAGRIESEMNEPSKVIEVRKPITVKKLKTGVFIYDFGQNISGWARIKISGNAGTQIKMRFAETLQKDGSLFTANLRSAKATDIYILKGDSIEKYEPRFTYHGFRYVELSGVPGLPAVISLEGCIVHDDVQPAGYFECSDTLLNKIYQNIRWSTRGNYHGMPTDCPQRDERLGWLGDRATGCWGESYMYNIYGLYEKWLDDIRYAQRDDGSIPDIAPTYMKVYSDNATWAGAYILAANMLYTQYGSTEIIARHYDS